jgi:hypothetical protein
MPMTLDEESWQSLCSDAVIAYGALPKFLMKRNNFEVLRLFR